MLTPHLLDAALLARPQLVADAGSARTLDLSRAMVRILVEGDGPVTLVLSPDPPNVIEHCRPVIERLARRLRVVAVELPGFGFSRAEPGFRFTVEDNARLLIELLERLALPPYALALPCAAGHIAFEVAAQRPDLVTHLVAIQTAAPLDQIAWARRIDRRGLVATPFLGQLLVRLRRERIARSWYRSVASDGVLADALAAQAVAALDAGAAYALASALQGLRSLNTAPRTLSQPTVVIWGEADRSHRLTDRHAIASMFAQARWASLAHGGHFPDLQEPDWFAAEVARLLPG